MASRKTQPRRSAGMNGEGKHRDRVNQIFVGRRRSKSEILVRSGKGNRRADRIGEPASRAWEGGEGQEAIRVPIKSVRQRTTAPSILLGRKKGMVILGFKNVREGKGRKRKQGPESG